MKTPHLLVFVALVAILFERDAFAYVGPGGGLSIVGSVLALSVAILAALFGFVWFPLKRLLRRMKSKAPEKGPVD